MRKARSGLCVDQLDLRRLLSLAGTLLIAALLSQMVVPGAQAAPQLSKSDTQSLEVAFGILEDTFSGEAELKWLLMFKKLTLAGPAKQVEILMKKMQTASSERGAELKKLRKLEPKVTSDPPPSPMGDAIQSAAQEAGTEELIFAQGVFNIRFLFLQAQATRMISVVAAEAAKVDPNAERQEWLNEVATQFQEYRDEIVELAKDCAIK